MMEQTYGGNTKDGSNHCEGDKGDMRDKRSKGEREVYRETLDKINQSTRIEKREKKREKRKEKRGER